jgi:hypothetical protein
MILAGCTLRIIASRGCLRGVCLLGSPKRGSEEQASEDERSNGDFRRHLAGDPAEEIHTSAQRLVGGS